MTEKQGCQWKALVVSVLVWNIKFSVSKSHPHVPLLHIYRCNRMQADIQTANPCSEACVCLYLGF